ncbi:MAG: thiamine phosphate synthase [Planctomycetes bacterium]|nr:thiamine phosphate synthase [Planctomycetota bacterium]
MDPDLLRIIDANTNRAREALRVIEDYARFLCDDAAAAEAIKTCRHELRRLSAGFDGAALLSARDTAADVGRDLKTASELERTSAEDVLRAAFARLTEATRVLGEFAKLKDATLAAAAESLRYRAYELEQRIVLRSRLRARFAAARLYVLITEAACRRDWYATAEAAVRGGAGILQLREKDLPDAELLRRAQRLRALTAQQGVLLVINDRPDIAKLARADGVHVGQDDLSVRDARRIGGGTLLVGKSTHTLEQFKQALAEEPDYLAVGPMFPSPTKPQEHIAGPQTLAEAAKLTQIPIVGIGGITAANAARIIQAGASCVCACSAISEADEVEIATREMAERVQQ